MDIILLNGQVIVIIFSIIIRYEYMLKRLVSLVCDAVYFNPFSDFKQWYTPYEKSEGNNCQVEYCDYD